VKVFFADKSKVMQELCTWAAELRSRRPDVEKVGLFGSYATDTYGPHSDADLLIILRASEKPFRDRIPEFLPDGISIPCDIFPYTATEIENLRREDSPWITRILKEVVWL
jgi:predicted nucleotidyltransferase